MDFPKKISIEACEQLISNLGDKPEEVLQLPVDTSALAFGGLASAIQAANTWMRGRKNRAVLLRSSTARDVVADINERPHKFSVAMCSTAIAIDSDPETDLRPQINLRAKETIDNQEKSPFGQQRGGLCWFAFVDHSSKGFDRNFYIQSPGGNFEPRHPEQIGVVIKSMIDKSMSVVAGTKPLSGDTLDCIGRIFFELFLNTHEHGTRGHARNNWFRPGMRVIYTNAVNLSTDGSSNITESQPFLHQYVESATAGSNNKKRFVEIGIVDSGLGYCGRWLADQNSSMNHFDLSIDDQYQIFQQCFQFRQTSTQKENKGNGLPVVMDRLTKLGGFIRIRSDRLSLYRNFISSPYHLNDNCDFYDWVSGLAASESLTEMSACCGVSITLLIPLEEKL
ncbi:hypothetical protein [Kangiella sp.]|uniref:hypothetical protein n=1 Tax=Kangiella sp. TaxID=1920245 RepID=UPI003A959033